jgi:hypothetical protein
LRGSPCFSLALYGIICTRFTHHHALLRKSRHLCNTPHPNKAHNI